MLNKDVIENIENNRRRGLILENLKQKYPDGVDFVVLQKALEIQGHSLSKRELASLIEYLKDGEYVKVTYFKNYILVITLSKKGIDYFGMIQEMTVKLCGY